MNFALSSTAELYREHRRTLSAKKKLRIADELQRRHDEQNCPRGFFPRDRWYTYSDQRWRYNYDGRAVLDDVFCEFRRFDFRLML